MRGCSGRRSRALDTVGHGENRSSGLAQRWAVLDKGGSGRNSGTKQTGNWSETQEGRTDARARASEGRIAERQAEARAKSIRLKRKFQKPLRITKHQKPGLKKAPSQKPDLKSAGACGAVTFHALPKLYLLTGDH